MRFIQHLTATDDPPNASLVGAKTQGLFTLMGLGLPVPPGFVISTEACRQFLNDNRFPDGLDAELTTALSALRQSFATPLLVSVRSGAAVSMPGMMNTFLNIYAPDEDDSDPPPAAHLPGSADSMEVDADRTPDHDDGRPAAADPVRDAVEAVFASWNTPRAVTYRELHDIPHDLGTAVIIQAMVFGDLDSHSGSGVAFSRDPNTGEAVISGDVLFGQPGEDVVSGRFPTRPIGELAARASLVWAELVVVLGRLEKHFRDVCHVEFTYESGQLWLLQVRSGGLSGRAAVRSAVELVDEGLIDRRTALSRVSPQQLKSAQTPRIQPGNGLEVITRGVGASPGVATGRIAVTADNAARMAMSGPVVLVRPHTSPLDMHGLAAATGIVTSTGGPTSHAAVVARSMGKPAVVSATALTVDPGTGSIHTPAGPLPEGTLITIDGHSGEVVLGSPATDDGDTDPYLARLLKWADEAITEGTT